ncbi:MAG: MraY family glycosyltransferase [Campylobacterota bacterium]|nr:MraY family glycosyltransferase [Campylobacterota bacterium]
MHTDPIPRGGGICFVGSTLIISFLAVLFDYRQLTQYYYIYIAIAIVFLTGMYDDKNGISPKAKFLFILLASILLFANGIYIKSLGTFLGQGISLPLLFAIPFTAFAIVGFTNALNLIDGLDGLAGTITVIILGAFLWIGYAYHDYLMILLSSLFMASITAFLFFNWNPAKVFMGDSGSLTLGFVVSILAIRATDHIEPTAVLFIVVLPVLDTFIVMTRRIQRGISPFSASKTHMHHILYSRYRDVKYTVIILLFIQIAFTIIGLQFRNSDGFLSLILFAILFFIFLNLFDERIRHRKKVGNNKKSKKDKEVKETTQES